MKRASRTLLLSLLGLAPTVAASDVDHPFDVDATLQSALEAARTTLIYDEPTPGQIDVSGATWKAHFTSDGATYVPFLGADAPRNFPVTFRLASATLQGAELPLAERPTVTRSGDRVVLDHGSILEVYDLAPTSIEQSFILPRRTARGEVQVRIDVESDLTGVAAGRALRFEGAYGAVEYGEAFALDAAGHRADVRAEYQGGSISLTVPDVFPIEGEGRLVIDPVITTDAPVSDLVRASNPDVAFEKDISGDGVYIMVYETDFSSIDRDLFAVEVRVNDFAAVNLGAVDLSSVDVRAPAVAVMDAIDRFLIVYERNVYGTPHSEIYGRVRIAGTTTISNPQLISDEFPNSSNTHPDVGGDNGLLAVNWCVVWRQSSGSDGQIRARAVTTTGVPVGFSRTLSGAGSGDDTAPTISEGSSNPYGDGRLVFAFERGGPFNTSSVHTGELRLTPGGVQVVQGAFRLGELGNFSRPSVSCVTPVLSSGGDPIYAVAVESEGGSQPDTVITFLCAGGGIQSLNNITHMEDIRPRRDARRPAIAWAGGGFVIAYEFDDLIYMASASIADVGTRKQLALGERAELVRYPGANGLDTRPMIASRFECGDLSSKRALIAYRSTPVDFIDISIHVGELEMLETPAVGRQYCSATQNSSGRPGWLALFGDQSPTSTKTAVASDLPSSQFVLLINSLQDGFVASPGGSSGNLCLSGAIGRMGSVIAPIDSDRTATILVDPTRLESPTGLVAAQPGETWHFQGWFRDTNGGTVTSNFTNAVEVEMR
ncbi:MAG: hypothetical protein AAGA20_24090 [Planctomycetota bacterium]